MKLLRKILPLVYFLLLVSAATFPAILHLNDRIIGDGYDNYEFIGFQHVVAERLPKLIYPFSHTDYLRYPVGFDLGKGFDGLLAAITGGLISLVIPPVTVFNLTVFLLFFLNFFSSLPLFKKISGSTSIATFTAGSYALSYYVLARNGSHINLTLTAGFPLTLLGLYYLIEKISIKNLALVASGVLLTSIGSLQYLVLLALFILVLVILNTLINFRNTVEFIRRISKSAWPVAISVALTLLTGIVLHYSYFSSLISGSFVLRDRQKIFGLLSPRLSELFIPNKYISAQITTIVSSSNLPSIEQSIFLGFIEVALLILAVILPGIKTKTKLLWLSVFVMFNLLISKTIYQPLVGFLPFSAVPEINRFVIVSSLAGTILIAHFLKNQSHRKFFPLLMAGLLLSLIATRLTTKFYLSPTLTDPSDPVISGLPGQAVLDLPFDPLETKRHQQVFLRKKKAVDGYVHWSAEDVSARSFIKLANLDDFTCNDSQLPTPLDFTTMQQRNRTLLENLKNNDVLGIVIHQDGKILYTQCQAAREKIAQLVPNQFIIADSNGQVATLFHENPASPHLLETVFFPDSGTLTLNNVLIYPTDILPPRLMLGDTELSGYAWQANKDGLNLSPKDSLNFKIPAGSTLTIYSPTPLFLTTYTTLWYSFTRDQDSISVAPKIERVYDDSRTTVYRLN